MASNTGAYWAKGLASFLKGYQEAKSREDELKQAAAERAIEREIKRQEREAEEKRRQEEVERGERKFQFELEKGGLGSTVVGPEGKIYRSEGVGRDVIERLGSPKFRAPFVASPQPAENEIILGKTGKLTVQQPAAPKPRELLLTPEQAKERAGKPLPEGINVTILSEKHGGTLTPQQQQQMALYTSKKLMDEYIATGSLDEQQSQLLKDASAQFPDISLVPEEEQGLLYSIQKVLGGGKEYHPVVSTSGPETKVKQINSQAEYEALPRGAAYRDSTGKTKIKK